jgi:uncharacterized protein (UPF0371 family)
MNNADMPAMAQPVTLDAYGDITVAFDHDTDYMGLTKREHFAGLAMQGLLAAPSDNFKNKVSFSKYIEQSVILADALLKELEK